MALNIVRQFKVSSDGTPVVLSFLHATNSGDLFHCKIDSQNPAGLGGIVGARYSLHVQLDQTSQSLLIHETVTGLNAGNAVEGTVRIPIALLEKPTFHSAAGRGGTCIKFSLPLRKGEVLKNSYFEWHIKGSWSKTTARALQMYTYKDWAGSTRNIEIALLNAPKGAHEMKGDILRAFDLPVNKTSMQQAAKLSPASPSIQSLSDTPQRAPQAGVAKIPLQSIPSIREKEVEQKARTKDANIRELEEKPRQREEEARLKKQRDGTISSAPPCAGTSLFSFLPTLKKETPHSIITNAYQTITFMHPYKRYSSEELRLVDYTPDHTMGDLGVAQNIQSILAEKQQWQEKAAKYDKEASDLRTMLKVIKVNYLAQQMRLTNSIKLIESLQTKISSFEAKHHASSGQNKDLQSTIKTLEEQFALESTRNEASLPQSQVKNSTIETPPDVLYMKNLGSDGQDLLSSHEDDGIMYAKVLERECGHTIYKIPSHNHEAAAKVLEDIKRQCFQEWPNFAEPSESGLCIDNTAPRGHYDAERTESSTGLQPTEASERYSKITQENAALQAEKRSLQIDLTLKRDAMERHRQSSTEEIRRLQAKVESLEQKLQANSTISQLTTTEYSSVDLLGLDFNQNTEADSVPILSTSTFDQATPAEFHAPFSDAAAAFGSTKNQGPTTTAAASTQSTGTTPISSASTLIDPDMILRIDDAVDAVSQEARKALKAGKGVTVQITEPAAIPDWLEQVQRRIVIDKMGVVRAAP